MSERPGVAKGIKSGSFGRCGILPQAGERCLMATPLINPKLELSMTECVLVEWLANDGAQASEGDAIYAVEIAKSTPEIAAPIAVTLRHLDTAVGPYEIGTIMGEII